MPADAQDAPRACHVDLRFGLGVPTRDLPSHSGDYTFSPGMGGGVAWLCSAPGRLVTGVELEVQTMDEIGMAALVGTIGKAFESSGGESRWSLRANLGVAASTPIGGFSLVKSIGKDVARVEGVRLLIGGSARWTPAGTSVFVDFGVRLLVVPMERCLAEGGDEFAGFSGLPWFPISFGVRL